MPRKQFIRSDIFPYHITARSHNRDKFGVNLTTLWNVFEDWLYLSHIAFGMNIHSFVLMENHFHLLASFPNNNISECMNYFMKETANSINSMRGKINQVYGGRYHRSLIKNNLYFMHAYKYVYRNPVEAKICKKVQDYPYSTIQMLVGKKKVFIPLEHDFIFFDQDFAPDALTWLNTKPTNHHKKQVKNALKKSEFKIALDRTTKSPSKLEDCLY